VTTLACTVVYEVKMRLIGCVVVKRHRLFAYL
jgi:hypothetical protein